MTEINNIKGIEDVAGLVEIDKVWGEEYGLTPVVELSAKRIFPKRISGVSKLKVSKNNLIGSLISMPVIHDSKFEWMENIYEDEHVKQGLYLKSSDLKHVHSFIAIDLNILLPPESYDDAGEYKKVGKKSFGIACAVYDQDDRLIALFDQKHHKDQAIFKYKLNAFKTEGSQLKTETSIVLGFKESIKPAKIRIFPEANTPNDIFVQFYVWDKDDDYFSVQEEFKGESKESEYYIPNNVN